MKDTRLLLTLAFLALFVGLYMGCNGSPSTTEKSSPFSQSGGSPVVVPSPTPAIAKSILSVWETENLAWKIDFSAGAIGGANFTAVLTMADNVSKCSYVVSMTGTSAAGACSIVSHGVWNTMGSDPGCAANSLDMCGTGGAAGSGTYANDGTHLTFNNDAVAFH